MQLNPRISQGNKKEMGVLRMWAASRVFRPNHQCPTWSPSVSPSTTQAGDRSDPLNEHSDVIQSKNGDQNTAEGKIKLNSQETTEGDSSRNYKKSWEILEEICRKKLHQRQKSCFRDFTFKTKFNRSFHQQKISKFFQL